MVPHAREKVIDFFGKTLSGLSAAEFNSEFGHSKSDIEKPHESSARESIAA
jgi:hypothetical protein